MQVTFELAKPSCAEEAIQMLHLLKAPDMRISTRRMLVNHVIRWIAEEEVRKQETLNAAARLVQEAGERVTESRVG